ncbi:MAG: hypothetical protein ACOY94_29110 [Bacillota bacterium]
MSRWVRASRLLSAFAIGVAAAIWLFPVIAGPRVQQLRLERDEAISKVEALQAEVVKLKEAERKRSVGCEVRRARAEMEGPDDRVGLEAGRRIQKELSAEQIGRRIDDISFLMLYTRYHGQLMEIDGILYQVEVKGVAIGPELTLYGKLKPVEER